MSLVAHIRAEMTPSTIRCKTCLLLPRLTDEDRADFANAVANGIQGAVLSRAINARLAELSIDDSLGEGSVRTHVREKHSA